MQTQKGRIIELDIVRVIGVFLVVLGHLVNEHPIRMYIYAFHMPLFFLVSGMLYKAKNCLSDLRIFRKYIIPALFFMILFHLCWYPARLLYSIHNLSAISFYDITLETLNHIFTDFTKILQFNPIVANIPIWFLFALGWCNFFLFLCMKRKWFALLPLVILVLSQWVKLPLFFSQASFCISFFFGRIFIKK